MTILRKKPLLSLLLALVMVVSLFPMSALAADETDVPIETEHICEDCEHEHQHTEEPASEVYGISPDTETTSTVPDAEAAVYDVAPDTEAVTPDAASIVYSGHIGDSGVAWELDPTSGRLFITGEGGCETFTSRDDQPWAAVRTEIREVWFDGMDTLAIENLAYWFTGCTALISAELPYTTLIIGEAAFADCPMLSTIMFYYSDSDEIQLVSGAFFTSENTDTMLLTIAEQQRATLRIATYAWEADNRHVHVQDVYGVMPLAGCSIGGCTCTSCTWYYSYDQVNSSVHSKTINCTGCNVIFWYSNDAHSYNNSGYCTLCGYYNSAYDYSSVCYHTSTRTTWSGCDWYEYCRSCGELVDSGTSHGTYVYGAWAYYNATRHRRLYSCSDCGEGSYQYGNHSTVTQYTQYNETQHAVQSYCATCSSFVGTATYANHSFTYGEWEKHSASLHKRLKTCSQCGYSEYEYVAHTLTYSETESYSEQMHRRSESCAVCGYVNYQYGGHTWVYEEWASISITQHSRNMTCSLCSLVGTETGNHADADNDGKCDTCGFAMTAAVGWHAAINGGRINNAPIIGTIAAIGGYAVAPSILPVKSNYTFTGWFTTADGDIPYTEKLITERTTFFAQYTPNVYAISYFDAGGGAFTGTHGSGFSTTHTYDTETGLVSPTRDGYNFGGWYTDKGCTGEAVTSLSATGYTEDISLYAKWSPIEVFSVTVPASLVLTVSELGDVYAAANAAIVNNSTGAVEVTGVEVTAESGWTLVPFGYDMAAAKVDSKLIGFAVNNAQSRNTGASETLSLTGTWSIAKGASLPLSYEAVVSATSRVISEQVLTVVFVLEWAA